LLQVLRKFSNLLGEEPFKILNINVVNVL
jgi:hypothetical protein